MPNLSEANLSNWPDLSDEEIADFRAYLGRFKMPARDGDPLPEAWGAKYGRLFFNAMPRLLDEVERRRSVSTASEPVRITQTLDYHWKAGELRIRIHLDHLLAAARAAGSMRGLLERTFSVLAPSHAAVRSYIYKVTGVESAGDEPTKLTLAGPLDTDIKLLDPCPACGNPLTDEIQEFPSPRNRWWPGYRARSCGNRDHLFPWPNR